MSNILSILSNKTNTFKYSQNLPQKIITTLWMPDMFQPYVDSFSKDSTSTKVNMNTGLRWYIWIKCLHCWITMLQIHVFIHKWLFFDQFTRSPLACHSRRFCQCFFVVLTFRGLQTWQHFMHILYSTEIHVRKNLSEYP